jgi:hypothetical protein
MKFIFADSLDVVDPDYDFIEDRSKASRKAYWDDVFPHEIMGYAPYDGMLVSRATVGDRRIAGVYTEAQAMRFHRVGARNFLRLDTPEFSKLDIFGDCGAFSYVKDDVPPYTPEDTVEFYDHAGFTHGCSVDHIIFEFNADIRGMDGGSADARRRFDITLENASAFLKASKYLSGRFIPMGVIQAWSPDSMAEAARRLVAMGYEYLAVGGMVPLKAEQIRQCLDAIRQAIPTPIRLHVLGFAKADEIASFIPYRITSFDTTSPLIRAFKDEKQNYYMPAAPGKLCYYTAIRVPQAIENNKLKRLVKMGSFRAEELTIMEYSALKHLRAYDRNEADMEQTLAAVLKYNAPLATERPYEDARTMPIMQKLEARYRLTLADRPWKKCQCPICIDISIEVIIFRASNRNKRRGIHNLAVYKSLVDKLDIVKVFQ